MQFIPIHNRITNPNPIPNSGAVQTNTSSNCPILISVERPACKWGDRTRNIGVYNLFRVRVLASVVKLLKPRRRRRQRHLSASKSLTRHFLLGDRGTCLSVHPCPRGAENDGHEIAGRETSSCRSGKLWGGWIHWVDLAVVWFVIRIIFPVVSNSI